MNSIFLFQYFQILNFGLMTVQITNATSANTSSL